MPRLPALGLACALSAGCATPPITLETLAGTRWNATELADAGAPKAMPTLQFTHAAQVSGSGGCNRFTGKAMLAGESLQFGPLASTRMACPGAAMQIESRFFRALGAARAARLEDGLLVLLDEAGEPLLRLSPVH